MIDRLRFVLSPVLIPLAGVYFLLVAVRNWLFKKSVFSPEDCGAIVVSIGNLSSGGTGKTPIVAAVARELARSTRVGIVLRGYGRKGQESQAVSADAPDAIKNFGDEAVLLADQLQDIRVPVQVGAKRVRAAQDLVASRGVPLIVLDDGFQHRWMDRDFDFVLVDASSPRWEARPLPWGLAREPLRSLCRATAVFLTKTETVSEGDLTALEKRVRDVVGPTTPIVRWVQAVVMPTGSLVEQGVITAAGIAKPQQFFTLVRQAGLSVHAEFSFRDHHMYDQFDVEQLVRNAERHRAAGVLVTEKDAVKLVRIWPKEGARLLSSRLEVRPARESDSVKLEQIYESIRQSLRR